MSHDTLLEFRHPTRAHLRSHTENLNEQRDYSFANNPVTDVYCAGKTSACSWGHLPQVYCGRSCNASWAALRADPTSLPSPVHAQGKMGIDVTGTAWRAHPAPLVTQGCWARRAQVEASVQLQPQGWARHTGTGSRLPGPASAPARVPCRMLQEQGSPCARMRIRRTPDAHVVSSASQQGHETQPALWGCKGRQTAENVHFQTRETIIKYSMIFQIPCFTHQFLLQIYLDVFKLC